MLGMRVEGTAMSMKSTWQFCGLPRSALQFIEAIALRIVVNGRALLSLIVSRSAIAGRDG